MAEDDYRQTGWAKVPTSVPSALLIGPAAGLDRPNRDAGPVNAVPMSVDRMLPTMLPAKFQIDRPRC